MSARGAIASAMFALTAASCTSLRTAAPETLSSTEVKAIIERTCVDKSGKLDRNLASGWWLWTTKDIDLNGNGLQDERIVLIYSWQKWGESRKRACREFARRLDQESSWVVNGVMILQHTKSGWTPTCYQFKDYDGMSVWMEESVWTGLPILVSAGGKDHAVWVWGVSRPNGQAGYLAGQETRHGVCDTVPQFMVRTSYPK